ncbi:MAG TPA: hypothetical protein VMZ28_25145 [Kofleriaceae bacterium]|nr:hypothetical protein [Kofleriaceae bacterium]
MHARTPLLLLLLAPLACAAEIGAPDGDDLTALDTQDARLGFAVGISDSDASSFTHPAWDALDVRRARAVAPYDVAQRPATDRRRRMLEAWLAAADAAGVEPYVTLARSDLDRRADGVYRAPGADAFEAGFRAFRLAYPDVRLIGAWNEPNFDVSAGGAVLPSGRALADPSCPIEDLDHCGPLRAAFYWRIAHKVCPEPTCVIVAGEFDSTPHDTRYWDAYRRGLRTHRPRVWSIHPHVDANRFQSGGHHCVAGDRRCVTRTFMAWLNGLDASWDVGHVWLTEVGAYRRNADGELFSDASQRAATAFILRLPQISPRITRIYYYNLQNACGSAASCPVQDRGLIAPAPPGGGAVSYDGRDRVRAAFDAIASRND